MGQLSFFGAAGTVTGSCTRLTAPQGSVLIDCGLFQGNKTVRALNEAPFPFDAATVDALVMTHAHMDHSGLVPKLVAGGFAGQIHATPATTDLLAVMLADSARIQASQTERENRKRERRGEPPRPPIYTEADVETVLERLQPHPYESWFEPRPGLEARFVNAGHILGSASVEIRYPEPSTGRTMRLLFSGDIGPEQKVFHPEPEGDSGFDYLICESTYGDRERADYTLETRRQMIRDALTEGLSRGGNVVIPCFAVERSQELLHDIGVLLTEGAIPDCTVFLDSPLAKRVTEVFIKHAASLDDIAVDEAALFRHPKFRLVQDVEESKAINRITGGAVIISASGMADAGRIQHHLKNNIWRRQATVLFVGYQAPGTLGHIILDGARDVRIHGKSFRVNAAVRSIGNYSAHADQGELIDWIEARSPVAGGVFLNHGDDAARAVLRDLLAERGIPADQVHVPAFDEHFEITADTPQSKGRGPARIDEDAILRDWQNDHAAFLLALENRLAEMGPAERRALLATLQAAL